ncbi:MAG: NDP-sugar synthase [Acidobacteriota bacterium]|nr:NDP-sugar synthase [Acidobacteriota bacterium]
MSTQRLRALVLAAGEGRRLRPLTLAAPKPLLPVAGEPIVRHTLAQLAEHGFEAAALNLHHLGDQIPEHLGERHGEMFLVYSREPELLGTLGAAGPLRYFLEPASLMVVVNGDSLCRWPIKSLLKAHKKSEAAATVLVTERADPEPFGGGIGLDAEDRVVSFRRGEDHGTVEKRMVFAGLHVFSPRLLESVEVLDAKKPQPADFVRDLYEPMLRDGQRIQALRTTRDWHDLGTPRRYLEGVLDWTRGRTARRLLHRRSWVAEGAEVHPEAELNTCAIEAGAVVEAGARIENSLLLPGAHVGRDSRVRDAILGFDALLPPTTYVEGRMVNPQTADFTAGPDDSLLGELVYTRL